jgi:hypothetical protein
MPNQDKREPDRAMTRLFLAIGALLALLAAGASLALRSWWPLGALGLVVGGVMVITLAELSVLTPLLRLVMRAGERGRTAGAARRTSPAKAQEPSSGSGPGGSPPAASK